MAKIVDQDGTEYEGELQVSHDGIHWQKLDDRTVMQILIPEEGPVADRMLVLLAFEGLVGFGLLNVFGAGARN